MKTGLLTDKILNEFCEKVKECFPKGTTKRGFPLTIGRTRFSVVIFKPDSERKGVRFGLFLFKARYSRKSLAVHPSGIVIEEDVEGIIPSFDLTKNEPDLTKLTNKEIAIMVAVQLKALGYHPCARKK